jgi:hypothetical protein
MAGFDSGTVVEPLDYTFEAHIKGCKGTVPEPTDQQLADYLAGLKKLVREYQGQLPDGLISGTTDVGDLMSAVDDLEPDIIVKFHDGIAGLFAGLCSGNPDKATILKLPIRIRSIFYAWLQQEVMSPEAAPGGGNAQVVTMPRAAAG